MSRDRFQYFVSTYCGTAFESHHRIIFHLSQYLVMAVSIRKKYILLKLMKGSVAFIVLHEKFVRVLFANTLGTSNHIGIFRSGALSDEEHPLDSFDRI